MSMKGALIKREEKKKVIALLKSQIVHEEPRRPHSTHIVAKRYIRYITVSAYYYDAQQGKWVSWRKHRNHQDKGPSSIKSPFDNPSGKGGKTKWPIK